MPFGMSPYAVLKIDTGWYGREGNTLLRVRFNTGWVDDFVQTFSVLTLATDDMFLALFIYGRCKTKKEFEGQQTGAERGSIKRWNENIMDNAGFSPASKTPSKSLFTLYQVIQDACK